MRQIKEVLRLKHKLGLSQQVISDSLDIPRSTVRDYLSRAKAAGLSFPLPEEMDDEQLNKLLFPSDEITSRKQRPQPDWKVVHKELKRKGVTLQLLWEEYKRQHPDGYQYSWYALKYRQWCKSKEVWMPQQHQAGEKVFVDYSGLTFPIWKTNLQEVDYNAEIFVSVLGASDLIFCVATRSQKLQDWINAHNKMFTYYGGVTELIIPDNLRSGVSKAHRYEAICNRSYEELAQHYDCAIMPTRSRKPKDKAKVEKAVQSVQRRILAALRDKRFTSLAQFNDAINILLGQLNNKNFQKLPYSRHDLFNKVEQPTLKPLPSTPYQLAYWRQEKLNGGYHIKVNQHYYSVPHTLVGQKIEIRVGQTTVECFYQDKRIACHVRDDTPNSYSTVDGHRPEAHRQKALWNSKKLLSWSQQIGPKTHEFIKQLLENPRRHLYQKERSALGILRLSNAFDEPRLELACARALEIGTFDYNSLFSMLKKKIGNNSKPTEDSAYQSSHHKNVRGSDYYH